MMNIDRAVRIAKTIAPRLVRYDSGTAKKLGMSLLKQAGVDEQMARALWPGVRQLMAQKAQANH